MNEREEITSRFKGAIKEGKRTIYHFENPEDEKYDLKYSAFPPELPTLSVGKTYTFTVEHVPMGDTGKFYHNLARSEKDGPYIIEVTPEEHQNLKCADTIKKQDTRKSYWEQRNERDLKNDRLREEQQPLITRLSCMKNAALIIAAKIQAGEKAAMETPFAELKTMTEKLENFALQAKKQEKPEKEGVPYV